MHTYITSSMYGMDVHEPAKYNRVACMHMHERAYCNARQFHSVVLVSVIRHMAGSITESLCLHTGVSGRPRVPDTDSPRRCGWRCNTPSAQPPPTSTRASPQPRRQRRHRARHRAPRPTRPPQGRRPSGGRAAPPGEGALRARSRVRSSCGAARRAALPSQRGRWRVCCGQCKAQATSHLSTSAV
jgi:hypothetical protein